MSEHDQETTEKMRWEKKEGGAKGLKQAYTVEDPSILTQNTNAKQNCKQKPKPGAVQSNTKRRQSSKGLVGDGADLVAEQPPAPVRMNE
jgi:hypothetical protein